LRKQWILDAIDRYIIVRKVNDTVYELNQKKVNIQARKVKNNISWFNLGDAKYLPTMDFFVYICGDAKVFYNIPKIEMFRLAKVTTQNITDTRPQFNINIKTHHYLSGNTENEPIKKFYQKWGF
jgi:hypothetical protein